MLLRGTAISARQSPFFAKSPPSNLRTPQVRVPASGADGRKARFMRSRGNSRLHQSWYLAQGGESLGNLAGSLQGEGEKRDSTAFFVFRQVPRRSYTGNLCTATCSPAHADPRRHHTARGEKPENQVSPSNSRDYQLKEAKFLTEPADTKRC